MLHRDNLNAAYKWVRKNKGAAGIDGMKVEEAGAYLKENGKALIARIEWGKYTPKPVRRVPIPKPDGGTRMLGIPTVTDRIVQQAVKQVLEPICEPKLADGSFGYRPRRDCKKAVQRVEDYLNAGYTYAVVLDLSKYFETLDHARLLNILRENVKDERIIQTVKRFLKSGVMTEGVVMPAEEGSPQGGVISPLLANIYLDAFDQEYTRRGVPFVRYADVIVLLAKSRRAAQRLLAGSTAFLTKTRKLRVNEEKSRVTTVFSKDFKFLGFTFRKDKTGVHIRIHPKAKQKVKRELKEITKRSAGGNVRKMMAKVEEMMTGWLNYYSIAQMGSFIKQLAEWLRYRQKIWKQWKRPKARMRGLLKLGVDRDRARQVANTRRGYWRAPELPVINWAINNKKLAAAGCYNIEAEYQRIHLKSLKPPTT